MSTAARLLGSAAALAPTAPAQPRRVGRSAGPGRAALLAEGAGTPGAAGGQQAPRAPSRRVMLAGALAGACKLCGGGQARAAEGEPVCQQCAGTGAVPCPLCGGSGRFATGFGNVADDIECPNCEGLGTLRCTRCLGTGLAETAGLLRGPAVKEGHLRVRDDGSIEILDCDYFPATRGRACLQAGAGGDNRLTEQLVQTAPRGGLVKRPDLQLP